MPGFWAIAQSPSEAQVPPAPQTGPRVAAECIVSSIISNVLPPVKGEASEEERNHFFSGLRRAAPTDGLRCHGFKMTTTTGELGGIGRMEDLKVYCDKK